VRLTYTAFWPGFDAERCLFTWILRSRLGHTVEVVPSTAGRIDLEIRSVFTFGSVADKVLAYGRGLVGEQEGWNYLDRATYGYDRRAPRRGARVLWFTGENRRPPLGMADAYLGFEVTDETVPFLYFPFWMYRIDWGFESEERVPGMTPAALSSPRAEIERPRTCCAFSATREPGRLRLLDLVSTAMPLDRFGRGIGQWVDDKTATAARYGFQACPENDLYPGYVTEKAPEAWFSGNVPIWQGLDRDGWLNPEAMIDATGRTSQEVTEALGAITPERAAWMRRQPILTREPSLEPATEMLRQLLG